MYVRTYLPGTLPWVQIGKIVTATIVMALTILLFRHYAASGKVQLIFTIFVCGVVYAAGIMTLDVLGLRRRLIADVRTLKILGARN